MNLQAVTLRGPRVTLRPWREGDRAMFATINADPEVMQHFPAPLTHVESDALLARAQKTLEKNGWGNWALEIEGQFAGFAGLSRPSFKAHFTPCIEIGWRLARKFWGGGYASEAARLALAHGFLALAFEEIVSFTATTNLRSQHLMRRIGMRHDAADDFDHPRLPPGHPLQRHVLYRLARSDWLYSISS